jgi:arylsulfatase A-like enzyme
MHVGGVSRPLAIRQGDWKFVPNIPPTTQKGTEGDPNGMLFNLANDHAEAKDLAAGHPDKVKELQALLAQLRKQGRYVK